MLKMNKRDIPEHLLKFFRPTNIIKPKDEIDTPGMLAEALRADGWYRRSTIIWSKPNPMPESVTDRCTKSHEYIFLLTKSQQYFYDAEAIKEEASANSGFAKQRLAGRHHSRKSSSGFANDASTGTTIDTWTDVGTRNKRSVWTVATAPYVGTHFATFPPALIEPCILAGTSQHGVCSDCGAPWERVTEKESHYEKRQHRNQPNGAMPQVDSSGWRPPTITAHGWAATCTCNAAIVPATVLDPFSGSGTTVAVACAHGRTGIGIDLSADYIDLAHERIREAINESGRAYIAPDCDEGDFADMPLFQLA